MPFTLEVAYAFFRSELLFIIQREFSFEVNITVKQLLTASSSGASTSSNSYTVPQCFPPYEHLFDMVEISNFRRYIKEN